MFSSLANAIEALRKGVPIVIVDDQDRENEGDLVVAAECANQFNINFMIKHGSGVICVATTKDQLLKLELINDTPTLPQKADKFNTPFALSCDAKHDVTTGISAADRAHTKIGRAHV